MHIYKIVDFVNKFRELLKCLTLPYQIGFVKGHSHLTDLQVRKIKQVLNLKNDDGVLNEYEQALTRLIGHGYGVSFASGRMAFFVLLKVLNIGVGDEVVLPGFTCSVMVNAIWRTGATPIFADIDKETFGSCAKEIEKKITSRTKIIVAQHSFGIPCNIHEIVELGRKRGIFVLEDSAIALDSSFEGIKVGNWADAAMFSTDHSKPLNTLIGGLLYTKDKLLYEKVKNYTISLRHLDKAHQERLYNQFLFERKYHKPENYPRAILKQSVNSVVKKLTHKNGKFTFLEADYRKQPSYISSYPYPAKMPPFLAQLGLYELERWYSEKKRRKDILKEYLSIMKQSEFNNLVPRAYHDPDLDIVPLRFVFQYPDTEGLMRKMDRTIDIRWTWFRSPIICCPEGPESLGYKYGSCPVAEEVGNSIINWPCVLPSDWEEKVLSLFQSIVNEKYI